MGYLKLVALFVGGWVLVGCGSDGNSGGSAASTADQLCTESCAMAPPISCPNEPDAATCKSDCLGQIGSIFDKCKAQVNAYAQCGFSKGATDFECDADGQASLKSGVCSSELSAVVTCAGG
jgi:hypothetical protein